MRSEKYPAAINQELVPLQQYNSKPHAARRTKENVKNLTRLNFSYIERTIRIVCQLPNFNDLN